MTLQRNPLFSDLQMFTVNPKKDHSNTTTGVRAQLLVKHFHLFPNPTSGLVNLQARLMESALTLTIQLFNAAGDLLYTRNYRPTDGTHVHTQLNFGHLRAGTYHLVLETDTGILTDQIVIEEPNSVR